MLYDCIDDAHPVALRHTAGREIVLADDGIHRGQSQRFKRILFAGARRLGRIAVVPVPAREKIADLGNAFAADILHGNAALPEKGAVRLADDRPQPEPVRFIPRELPREPLIRLFIRKGVLVGVHRLLILQRLAERGAIVGREPAQIQPLRL